MTPFALQLEPAWREIAVHAGVPEAETRPIFDDLCERYSAADRHYHNLKHIAQMLEIIERFRERVHDYPAVCLAVWFHDVIYDSRRKDNEEQSAMYAIAILRRWVWESLRIHVSFLIGATKTHQARPGDTDCQLLLDADLAILGSPPAEYDRYAHAIRQEYAWVSEDDYRAGRVQVLQSFLQRDRLYWTEPLFQTLELPARRNMQREIERLTA